MGLLARLFRRGPGRAPLPPPSYSNAAVIDRIAKDENVDAETARRWFGELLIFLDLAAQSRESLSPPPDVDKAWHAFLIHSKDYEAYCRERFGKVVHHQPTGVPDPQAYARAYESRSSYAGQMDPALWAPPAAGTAVVGSDQLAPDDHGDHSHDGSPAVIDNPGGADPSPNLAPADDGGSGGGDSGGGDSGGSSDSGGGGDSGGGSSCGSSCGSSG